MPSRHLGPNDYSPFSGPLRDNLSIILIWVIFAYIYHMYGPNLCFTSIRSDCVCLTIYNPYESLSSHFVCVQSQVLFVIKFIIPPHTNSPIFSRNHTLSFYLVFSSPLYRIQYSSTYSQEFNSRVPPREQRSWAGNRGSRL